MMQPDSSSLSSARDENSAVTSGGGQPPLTVATPGPWVARSSRTSDDYGVIAQDASAEGGWVCIAECFSDIRNRDECAFAEAAANARLIAAAPDLLKACKQALYALKGREHDEFLRAAIAKAEGRAAARTTGQGESAAPSIGQQGEQG